MNLGGTNIIRLVAALIDLYPNTEVEKRQKMNTDFQNYYQ